MPSLRNLPLAEIDIACQQATAHFRQGLSADDRACLELFRRALAQNDQAAWHSVYEQYRRLVAHWLTVPGASADEVDGWVELAFEKFWRTLRGVRFASQFKTLATVLSYLRKCALSVRLDEARRQQREQHCFERLQLLRLIEPLEDTLLQRLTEGDLQAALRAWLDDHVQDDAERLIVRESYQFDRSPADIVRRHPDRFANADEVHRVKERLLKRLRRSPELRRLFDQSVGKDG